MKQVVNENEISLNILVINPNSIYSGYQAQNILVTKLGLGYKNIKFQDLAQAKGLVRLWRSERESKTIAPIVQTHSEFIRLGKVNHYSGYQSSDW